MPSASIDTFFACSLLVSVAIIATAFLAGTMQTQINGMQDLNKQDFIRALSDHLVYSQGTPSNWGSSGVTPTTFGLSSVDAQSLGDVDADKISRLNCLNDFAPSYFAVLQAADLKNIAFSVSVSPILQVQIVLSNVVTTENSTAYSFQVSCSQNSGPVQASLHGYVLAAGFEADVYNSTGDSGMGIISVEVPNISAGPGVLVVFARASFDNRVTANGICPFAHSSVEPQPNLSFMDLSPLNYELNATAKSSGTSINAAYAFSYSYESSLASGSNSTYVIPAFVDKSPIVLVMQGTCNETNFNEWVAYPQVPMTFGADLSNSQANVFVYPVTINGCLYTLTMSFGDVFK